MNEIFDTKKGLKISEIKFENIVRASINLLNSCKNIFSKSLKKFTG